MKLFKSALLVLFISVQLVALNLALANKSDPVFTIGTGGEGGTYYPVGQALSIAIAEPKELTKCPYRSGCGVKGLDAEVLVTAASHQNVTEVQQGAMESGLADAATLHFAYKGLLKYSGNSKPDLRVLANLFPEDLHLVLPKGAVLNGLADLQGKRVGIAQAGSGTQNSVLLILADYGITRATIQPFELNQKDSAAMLAAGKIDAYFYAAGTPVSTILNLDKNKGVELYSFSEAEIRKANKAVPYYVPSIIAAGTYPGVDYDVNTLAVSAMWVTHANQPEEKIYQIIKSLWNENAGRILADSHRKAQDITLDSALNGLDGIGVPLHPGAERFYKRACLFTVPRSENTLQRFPIVCGGR